MIMLLQIAFNPSVSEGPLLQTTSVRKDGEMEPSNEMGNLNPCFISQLSR